MDLGCWRFLDLAYDDPYRNVALEEALLRSVGSGAAPPTFRLWRNRGAVVIGAFQSPDLEVDLDACAAESLPVIRRVSGGGAVTMTRASSITLSFPQASPLRRNGFHPAFEQVGAVVTAALRNLGIDVSHPP